MQFAIASNTQPGGADAFAVWRDRDVIVRKELNGPLITALLENDPKVRSYVEQALRWQADVLRAQHPDPKVWHEEMARMM